MEATPLASLDLDSRKSLLAVTCGLCPPKHHEQTFTMPWPGWLRSLHSMHFLESCLGADQLDETGVLHQPSDFIVRVEPRLAIEQAVRFAPQISPPQAAFAIDESEDEHTSFLQHSICLTKRGLHIVQKAQGRDHDREIKRRVRNGKGFCHTSDNLNSAPPGKGAHGSRRFNPYLDAQRSRETAGPHADLHALPMLGQHPCHSAQFRLVDNRVLLKPGIVAFGVSLKHFSLHSFFGLSPTPPYNYAAPMAV